MSPAAGTPPPQTTLLESAHAAVRDAVATYTDRAQVDSFTSPLEAKLLAALWVLDLRPELQHPLGRYRVDFYFPRVHVAVEVDGKEWHNPVRDLERDRRIADQHDVVIKRYTGSHVYRDPLGVATDVKRIVDWIAARLHLVKGYGRQP